MNARGQVAGDEARLLAGVRDYYEHTDPMPPSVVERAQDAIAYDWRAWTVHQPWASAIVGQSGGDGGPKGTENRKPKRTRRIGIVLIHAARPEAYDRHAVQRSAVLRAWIGSGVVADYEMPTGAIIGTTVITGCHQCDGSCSPWAEPDAWHVTLGDRRALATPVPCKGALGFWRPSPDVLAAVLKQLGGAS